MVRLTSNSTCSSGWACVVRPVDPGPVMRRPSRRGHGRGPVTSAARRVRRRGRRRAPCRSGPRSRCRRTRRPGRGRRWTATMPMTLPSASSSGPPELPGFTDASNWMSPENRAPVGGRGAVRGRRRRRRRRCRRSPSGLPIATTPPPTSTAPPSVAGTTGCGSVAGASVAMSCLRVGGRDGRGRPGAVGEDQADRAAVGDDVVRGEHRAVRRRRSRRCRARRGRYGRRPPRDPPAGRCRSR